MKGKRAEAQEGKANGTKREPKLNKEGTEAEAREKGRLITLKRKHGKANKEGGHKGKERRKAEEKTIKEGEHLFLDIPCLVVCNGSVSIALSLSPRCAVTHTPRLKISRSVTN